MYICGKDIVTRKLSTLDTAFRFQSAGATPVHKAVESGYLQLVNKVFIDEIGFDPDFYTPDARFTLPHALIRAWGKVKLGPRRKQQAIELFERCSNLSLRDN